VPVQTSIFEEQTKLGDLKKEKQRLGTALHAYVYDCAYAYVCVRVCLCECMCVCICACVCVCA